jgi:hypothetical protein
MVAAEVAFTAAVGAVFGEAEVLEEAAFGAVAVLEAALAAVRLEAQAPPRVWAQAPTADPMPHLMPHLTEDRAGLALPPAAPHTEGERVHMARLAAAAPPMV